MSRSAELHRKIAAKRALKLAAADLKKYARKAFVFDDPRREGIILAAQRIDKRAERILA